jgi:hypothetical protein
MEELEHTREAPPPSCWILHTDTEVWTFSTSVNVNIYFNVGFNKLKLQTSVSGADTLPTYPALPCTTQVKFLLGMTGE